MARIDAHMHFSGLITKTGERSVDVLGKYYKEMQLDGANIMCCSSNGDLWKGFEADECIVAAIAKNEHPQTYIHGCMMLPNMVKAGEPIPEEFSFTYQLQMLMAMGFDGIKLCEFKPDSFVVNQMDRYLPDFEKYFDYCEQHDIPMCFHVADPEEAWDPKKTPAGAICYGNAPYPTSEKLYRLTYGILDRHPKLRVMLAHAFFLSEYPDRLIAVLEKYPNVTIDLAPGWEMFDGFRHHYPVWHDIFRTYADRFVFATDTDIRMGMDHCCKLCRNVLRFLETDDEFDTLVNHFAHGIALEKEPLEKILAGNCKRTVGNKPKKLDRSILREYCKLFMPYIPESESKVAVEDYLKKNIYG